MRKLLIYIMALGLFGMLYGCRGGGGPSADEGYASEEELDDEASQEPLTLFQVEQLLMADSLWQLSPYERHLEEMPDSGACRLHVNRLAGGPRAMLRDSNYLHLEAAERLGIAPVTGIAAAWEAGPRLVRLRSCQDYYVEPMTHSLPFLVPRAERLLRRIGRAFRDTLEARGGGSYRLKVTSALRTEALVRRLRRRNGNAVDSSAHRFGTTFDISYAFFVCDSVRPAVRTQEDLKNLLTEVVADMRARGELLAVYERKQSCIHITAAK